MDEILRGKLYAEFAAFKGDGAFLKFLERAQHLGRYSRPIPIPSDMTLARIIQQTRKLRREVEAAAPDFLPRNIETLGPQPASAAGTIFMDTATWPKEQIDYLTWLVSQLESRRRNLEIERPSFSRRGAPAKTGNVYYWLAALVPYTALIAGRPRWAWIGRWLHAATGRDIEKPDFYWKKIIGGKVRTGRDLDPQFRRALVHGAYAYFGHRRSASKAYQRTLTGTARDISPDMALLNKQLRPWMRPFDAREREYFRQAFKWMPFLRAYAHSESMGRLGELYRWV